MHLTSDEICRVAGVKRQNLTAQMRDFGAFGPSVRKGVGRGSARHLWSLEDAYRVAIFNELLKLGFNRQRTAWYIKALEDKHMRLLINVGMYLRLEPLRLAILSKFSGQWLDETCEVLQGNPDRRGETRKFFLDRFEKASNVLQVGIFLIFVNLGKTERESGRFGVWVDVAFREDPRFRDSSPIKGLTLPEVLACFEDAEDIFILDCARIMDLVSRRIVEYVPDKTEQFYRDWVERTKLPKKDRVSVYEILTAIGAVTRESEGTDGCEESH